MHTGAGIYITTFSPAVAPLVHPIAVHQPVNVFPFETVSVSILENTLTVALSFLHEAFVPDSLVNQNDG